LYGLAWTCRSKAVRYPLVLIINFVTIYTGFGIFLGVLTPLLLALDYWTSAHEVRLSSIYFVAAVVVALISLGSFFVGYRFMHDIECFSPQLQPVTSYLAFVSLMFANFFAVKGASVFPQIIGGLILVAILASLTASLRWLRRRKNPQLPDDDRTRALITLTFTVYSLLFCANAAYGRVCAGLWMATAPRYAIYLEPAVLGLYFFLLSLREFPAQRLLLSGFLLVVFAASLHVDKPQMAYFRDVKQQWKTCYLQTEEISQCDKTAGRRIFGPPPERTHLQEKLQYLKKERLNLYADSK
jgi:hypothetical protein